MPPRTEPVSSVGLNLLYLVPGQVGGTEIYAHQLVGAMSKEYPQVVFTVFCGTEAHASLRHRAWPDNVTLVQLPVRTAIKPLRVAAELLLLPPVSARTGLQVLHSLGTTAPLVTRSARVVTVHDLIYAHFPASFPAAARLGLKALVPAAARRSDRVIVPSSATRDDVTHRLGVDPGRVDVVPLGPGLPPGNRATPEVVLRRRWGLGDAPLVLTVAASLPHKNLDRLLQAFSRIEMPDAEPPTLLVVGHTGRMQSALMALAQELDVGDRIRLTGWVPEEDLEGVYAAAECFAYPSLYEGFGMPVLEAMSRGVPVACSDATSLPEVVGDAAELFDPTDVEAVARAIQRVLVDREHARTLVQRGHARVGQFSWKKTAHEVFHSYRRAWDAATRAG